MRWLFCFCWGFFGWFKKNYCFLFCSLFWLILVVLIKILYRLVKFVFRNLTIEWNSYEWADDGDINTTPGPAPRAGPWGQGGQNWRPLLGQVGQRRDGGLLGRCGHVSSRYNQSPTAGQLQYSHTKFFLKCILFFLHLPYIYKQYLKINWSFLFSYICWLNNRFGFFQILQTLSI